MKKLQGALLIVVTLLLSSCGRAMEPLQTADTQPTSVARSLPEPGASTREEHGTVGLEVATLGAGCFWCVETVFADLKGVQSVVSGYSGGKVANPSYQQVCTGSTGHAEAVNITFDPKVITYRQLLEVFFSVHDPTTLNRQGADVGTQYRSAIFCHDEQQRKVAEQVIREESASGDWKSPIVTEVVAYSNFYPAEKYHQGYYDANPDQPYCQIVITPKKKKFRQRFQTLLKNP